MTSPRMLAVHYEGATLVVAPNGPISNLAGHELQPELDQLLALIHQDQCHNVLIDMEKVSFFGSVMLGAMNTIWRQIRQWDGTLALCNLSQVGGEVVHIARFDTLWPIYPSRQQALDAMQDRC